MQTTTLYHVARNDWQPGCDLLPLTEQYQWGDEVAEFIAAQWPDCDPWAYYSQEASQVHCFETLDEAREFAAEYGGQIVSIDVSNLPVRSGKEYPHPVVCCAIAASRITVVE